MMFYTPDSGTFSKADILRGIITEKLSIATRDILAVVERTVADYEEEASGFRRRIARQERQLELLQPRVHLHRLLEEPEPEPRGSEELDRTRPPKEELLSPPPGTQDSVRMDFPQENNDDDDDGGGGFDDEANDEEEQVQPSAGSTESSTAPDVEIPSRSMSHRPPRHTFRPRRVWTKNSPTHLDLRIRLMMDPNVSVFRCAYLKNTLVRDFSFPRDLPESEFVDLLRSSFPPLAGSHKAFDIYTVNRSKKLLKLPLKTMTPNEIIRSIKANAPLATILVIKLQNPEAKKKSEETSEEKLKGASEEIKEESEENTEENMEEDTEEEHLEEDIEENVEDSEGIEDSHVSTVKDQPSSCDAEAAEDEAGPSSSSDQHGFREEAGIRDSPKHHKDSEVDDVDQVDASTEDPEWRLTCEQQKVVKKTPKKSLGKRWKKRACKVCGFWYRSLGSLIKHAWTHMNEPQRVCGVCGDTFESTEGFQEHLRTYDEVYKCEECGKIFVNIYTFRRHLVMHSENVDIRCDVCEKKFGSKAALNLHSWNHVEDRPHKCDLCEKSFGLKSLLQAHRKNHENKCHVCEKSFSTSQNLFRHLMSHSENGNFVCDVCGKRLKNLFTLNSHKQLHMTRERSFLCHICCKAFYCNRTLKTHLMIHSSERPFVCQDCGKSFLAKGDLKNHQRVHTGERPYVCSHCGQRFKNKTNLKQHVRTHLGIKPFVCNLCGKASATLPLLRIHMRTHTGERPYKCSLCDKTFTQSHCLKTHMMKNHAGENQNQTGP
ncbi:zinc finger protein ZFMSA12A [Oryzias melastigma]|nr:zinc finger protein ZFMSA12A [Oryzias melastigma]